MTKRRFVLVIVVLFALSAIWMGVRMTNWASAEPDRMEQRLRTSFTSSMNNCSELSTAAQQLTAVFHTSAQAALIDEAGQIISQTQEFLLLRDDGVRLLLLPDLSDSQRSQLRSLASKDEEQSKERLRLATAFKYEAYPYGDVVYPRVGLHPGPESASVTEMLSYDVAHKLEEDVLEGRLADMDAAYSSIQWLPYLREEAIDSSRLEELLAGEAPTRSLLKWELFPSIEVPASVDATTLVVYMEIHPLWDVLSDNVGTLAVWFVCTALVAAVIALGLDCIVRRKKHGKAT